MAGFHVPGIKERLGSISEHLTDARSRRDAVANSSLLTSVALVLIALITLAGLLIDLAIAGNSRAQLGFFRQFSVPARQAGRHSLGLGGFASRHFGHRVDRGSDGSGRGDLPRRICAQNWITEHHRDQRHQSRRRPVHRLWSSGAWDFRVWSRNGRSILTAGLTLALLILPIIVVATRESIRAVPAAFVKRPTASAPQRPSDSRSRPPGGHSWRS